MNALLPPPPLILVDIGCGWMRARRGGGRGGCGAAKVSMEVIWPQAKQATMVTPPPLTPKSKQKLEIKMQILGNGPKHNQNEISKVNMQRKISIDTLDFCQRAFVGW